MRSEYELARTYVVDGARVGVIVTSRLTLLGRGVDSVFGDSRTSARSSEGVGSTNIIQAGDVIRVVCDAERGIVTLQ